MVDSVSHRRGVSQESSQENGAAHLPQPHAQQEPIVRERARSTDSAEKQDERDNFEAIAFAPTLTIEPKGTLTLVLGTEEDGTGPRRVIVSLPIVRRLSPKFDEAIAQRARCHWTSPSKKELCLPDDNPDMLIQVMRIAHLQFSERMSKLKFHELVDLAQICKRYGINRIMVPFIPEWTDYYRGRILEEGKEEWLFVAYQFGFELDYLTLARHLTLVCTVDQQGRLVGPDGGSLCKRSFPAGALKRIQNARLELLHTFITSLYSFANTAISQNQCTAQLPPKSQLPPITPLERSKCTHVNNGSLQRGLMLDGFWPQIPSPNSIIDSVNRVAELLMNVKVLKYTRSEDENDPAYHLHDECDSGKRLARVVAEVLSKMRDPVDVEALERLRRNRTEVESKC